MKESFLKRYIGVGRIIAVVILVVAACAPEGKKTESLSDDGVEATSSSLLDRCVTGVLHFVLRSTDI